MTVQLELWQLLTTLGAFFVFVLGAGRVLFTQIDRRLTERFAAQDAAQAEAKGAWERAFADIAALERDFLRFQANLPLDYTRREDSVRNQTVIEAKIDAVMLHVQNLQLREAGRDAAH